MRRKIFGFEDLQALCPDVDIERFRDSFGHMLDTWGVIPTYTIGFHFSFDDENPEWEAEFLELVKLFAPNLIWAGCEEVEKKLTELQLNSVRHGYFEQGGFMVVLKVPVVGWEAPLEQPPAVAGQG